MKMLMAVALGGAIGASARYGIYLLTSRAIGDGFPWGTVIVNLLGSLLLGGLVSFMALKGAFSPELRALLVVGVLGAFTTFSTFSMDVVFLAERNAMGLLAGYLLMSIVGAVLAFWAGMRLIRLLLV